MKQHIAEQIADHFDSYVIEYEIDEEYSGRHMYGRVTTALIVRSEDVPLVGQAAIDCGAEHFPVRFRIDNMGLNHMVVY